MNPFPEVMSCQVRDFLFVSRKTRLEGCRVSEGPDPSLVAVYVGFLDGFAHLWKL
jgi:hypothetical protein